MARVLTRTAMATRDAGQQDQRRLFRHLAKAPVLAAILVLGCVEFRPRADRVEAGGAPDGFPPDRTMLPPDAPPADAPRPDATALPDRSPPGLDLRAADAAADVGPLPPSVNLSLGLVSRWKLDEASGEITADSDGPNEGVLNGAVRMSGGFPGARYANLGSLRFDGDDDFVELGTIDLPDNNRPQSVTFWFAFTTSLADDRRVVVSLGDGQAAGSRIKIGLRDDRIAAWTGNDDDLVTTALVPAGWHHLAYTYDGTTHRLFVDGARPETSTILPPTGEVASARLGADFDNSENFAGQLDDVRIYSRALNAAEVAALVDGYE
jgi:Concanavalin A-like lectin/glucanases superfamily